MGIELVGAIVWRGSYRNVSVSETRAVVLLRCLCMSRYYESSDCSDSSPAEIYFTKSWECMATGSASSLETYCDGENAAILIRCWVFAM